MALKLPDSMDELVYWTSRNIGEGKIKAWVEREHCPKCKKALMGKPKGPKGSIKIRASYYECPECHHKVEKQEYEDTLTASILYTCPKCKFSGDIQIPYKRKKFQGVEALVFECAKCKEKIPITKKIKEI
jgi:ssDNA-binding Zn-finger/Zn-ribbon topoisomerase 1